MDQATKDKILEALRTRQSDQIRGAFFDDVRGHRGCAAGIMAEALGLKRTDFFFRLTREGDVHPMVFLLKRGFPPELLQQVVAWNDSGLTFDTIARRLETELDRPTRMPRFIAVDAMTKDLQKIEDYANSFKLAELVTS